jgi:thiosulfate reductase/polysulfide reductase chain A
MKKTSRREFIKITSLGLGGAALAGTIFNWAEGSIVVTDKPVPPGSRRIPTYCEICFWRCAGWVYTNDKGEIWKLEGNSEDPHCKGRLCPRGTGGVGMYYDEDRLKTPLLRKAINGKQEFVEVSWEEALDFIAAKMKKIRDEYGPETMALFSHGSGGKYFHDLINAYGSNNYAAPSFAQCRGPRDVAWVSTFGDNLANPERTDIRDTRCLVLIGSHIGENMHNGQVQEMSEAIDKNAVIITVDPRFSTAASKSKYWLPVKPSTDIALLLAWMNVIITEGWYDKPYVEKYTYGFDQLKKHVESFTPEWAYGITTITPQQIRETAREIAKAAPAVIIHPGRHVTWYGDDTQRIRAIAILNALLGSWGRRGGFYNPEKVTVPEYPHPEFPKPKLAPADFYPDMYPLANEAVSNALVEASVPSPDRKNQIHGWIVNGTNLPLTIPGEKQFKEAVQHLELLVVIDTMPMEITGYADVVLPECTYLERYDEIRTNPHREPNIAIRIPAADPKYNSKPAWWMAREIAARLGLGAYFQWKDMEECLGWQLKKIGSSLEEMKRIGVKKYPRPFDNLYSGNGEDLEFNTNTGKIELYSTDLASNGFDPLPKYSPHEEPQPGYYRLIYGRAPSHTFSRTSNNPNLHDLMEENVLWVNPSVAAEWQLKNNQPVWLENQEGIVSTFPIKVRVTERIRWDSVYMVHGFGHGEKRLSRAYGRGASDTQLITNIKIDPVMGGTGMRSNFVTFKLEKPEGKEVAL